MRRITTGILIIVLCIFQLLSYSLGHAGIALDGTMGTRGSLTGPNYTILSNMGKQVGGNLFHSFSMFNINTGESATFTGPSSIQNIISRVTGGSASNIDGTLRSTIQGADLYFINPSGVMFGPNATLDVSGSFHISTADYIKLSDGCRFDATNAANSVLTSAPPSAFGFLSDSPQGISINGSFLQVPAGKTISLVGGDLSISNGNLYAPGGTINLISVASQGEAVFNGPNFNVGVFGKLGLITIMDNRADRPGDDSGNIIGNIDVSGAGGGDVYIRGGQFVMDDGYIFAKTYGDSDGRGIDIRMTGDTSLRYFACISVDSTGNGKGGDIKIETDNLYMTDATVISATAFSEGNGGDIMILVNNAIDVSGGLQFSANGLPKAVVADSYGSGNAGNITIETGSLSLTNAWISSVTSASGNGGNIIIRAKDAVNISSDMLAGYEADANGTVFWPGGILTDADGKGNAGNITIETGTLSLTNGAFISTIANVDGEGNGGNITIKAKDAVRISGNVDSSFGYSALSSYIECDTFGKGNAGNITIETGTLSVSGGGFITSTAAVGSEGKGGDITIKAKDAVNISGPNGEMGLAYGNHEYVGGIQSDTAAVGNAGDITIETGTLSISGGGVINAIAEQGSEGNGGNITIKATDVMISGYFGSSLGEIYLNSGIYGKTLGQGAGGHITINTDNLNLSNQGTVSVVSTAAGKAGNITISASGSINLQDSSITAAAENADGGNIQIQANNMVHLIDSDITATVKGGTGNGGNITIDPVYVILDNSKIIANANGGNGGNIKIDANVYLASPASIVNASAKRGLPGTVDIGAPLIDISATLAVLPSSYLDVNALLPKQCTAREEEMSSFVVKGRDGIPPQPDSLLTSP